MFFVNLSDALKAIGKRSPDADSALILSVFATSNLIAIYAIVAALLKTHLSIEPVRGTPYLIGVAISSLAFYYILFANAQRLRDGARMKLASKQREWMAFFLYVLATLVALPAAIFLGTPLDS